MVVPLTDEVSWVAECYPHRDGTHEHVSVYLVEDDGRYTVVDSGSHYHREAITAQLTAAMGGGSLDAIILSHSDYPHSANIRPFQAEWGDVELVASSGAPEQQGLPPDARKSTIGERMDVSGRPYSFIDPPLADRSHTTWIFDHEDAVLFTADGFGSTHIDGDCERTSRDFEDGIAYEDIHRHHRETLVWLKYADPEKLRRRLASIVDEYEPAWVAPIHGHPIHRDEYEDYFEKLMRTAREIADGYEVPGP